MARLSVPCSRSSTLLASTSGPERQVIRADFLLRQGLTKGKSEAADA
jgi:hypothetical protein